MIIRKKTLKELISKAIIATSRQCGRNLSQKQEAYIFNRILEKGKKKRER